MAIARTAAGALIVLGSLMGCSTSPVAEQTTGSIASPPAQPPVTSSQSSSVYLDNLRACLDGPITPDCKLNTLNAADAKRVFRADARRQSADTQPPSVQ